MSYENLALVSSRFSVDWADGPVEASTIGWIPLLSLLYLSILDSFFPFHYRLMHVLYSFSGGSCVKDEDIEFDVNFEVLIFFIKFSLFVAWYIMCLEILTILLCGLASVT